MSPNDKRHGTVAGHQAHRAAGEPACSSCVAAKTRYEKVRDIYGDRMVPAIGTRRRIQALKALGHSGADIAERLGVTYQAVHKLEHGTADKVFAATAEKVRTAFAEMCMTLPTGYHRTRIRNQSLAAGYAPPLAWDNIDDPSESPSGSLCDEGGVDPVAVDRLLSGEWHFPLTRDERFVVLERWAGSDNELERRTGWNVARMRREMRGAA